MRRRQDERRTAIQYGKFLLKPVLERKLVDNAEDVREDGMVTKPLAIHQEAVAMDADGPRSVIVGKETVGQIGSWLPDEHGRLFDTERKICSLIYIDYCWCCACVSRWRIVTLERAIVDAI